MRLSPGILCNSAGPPPSGVTWDPTQTTAVLSGGNLTASQTLAVLVGARATASHDTTGQYYFEQLLNSSAGNHPVIGIASSAWSYLTPTNVGQAGLWSVWCATGYTFGNAAYKGTSVSGFAAGDIVNVAVDFAAGKMWFGKNNVYILSGNPSTGANATWTGVTGTLWPFVNLDNVSSTTARFSSADWTYSPPTGFGQW